MFRGIKQWLRDLYRHEANEVQVLNEEQEQQEIKEQVIKEETINDNKKEKDYHFGSEECCKHCLKRYICKLSYYKN